MGNSFGEFLWKIPLGNSFGEFLWRVFGGEKCVKKVVQRSLSADPIEKGEIPLENSFGKFLAENGKKKVGPQSLSADPIDKGRTRPRGGGGEEGRRWEEQS